MPERGLHVTGYSEQAITALNGKGALRFVCIDEVHLMRSFDTRLAILLKTVWRHADETGEAYLLVGSPRFTLKGGYRNDRSMVKRVWRSDLRTRRFPLGPKGRLCAHVGYL